MSIVFDNEEPTNVSLFWEGEVTAGESVRITVQNGGGQFFDVAERNLQWGYRLYGEDYNLLAEPSECP